MINVLFVTCYVAIQDFDFGSIDVYTCTKSCSAAASSEAYCSEYIIVQPPPPVYRKVRTLPPAATGVAASDAEQLLSIAEGEDSAEA